MKEIKFYAELFWDIATDKEVVKFAGIFFVGLLLLLVSLTVSIVMITTAFLFAICIVLGEPLASLACIITFISLRFLNVRIGKLYNRIIEILDILNEDEVMLCPACKLEIVVTGQARLETLSEHVSDPNGIVSMKDRYECLNEGCETFGKVFWNEEGELYSKRNVNIYKNPISFIDNNDAPFGTFQRRMNVEIYKDDKNFYLFRNLFGWKLRVEWKYKSNNNGDILSRKIKLQWIKPSGGHYVSGISMFFYMIRGYKRSKNNPGSLGVDKIESYFEITNDKRWWKIASVYFLRVFQCRVYRSLKQ